MPRAASKGGDAAGANIEVMVPTLGESVTEATVSTWFKKEGDTVAADEMLCELETDKVSVEVPAPAAEPCQDPRRRRLDGRSRRKLGRDRRRRSRGQAKAPRHPKAEAAGRGGASMPRQGQGCRERALGQKLMAEKGLSPEQVRAPAATGAS
jgi:2-oxoglutarate dehydrogenase E2 component (dihydrolipoamide succinyltransferase)